MNPDNQLITNMTTRNYSREASRTKKRPNAMLVIRPDVSPKVIFRELPPHGLVKQTLNGSSAQHSVRGEAANRMGRRPLDRRCFRDACAAARSQLRLPEGVPQEADLGELIVCRLAYS